MLETPRAQYTALDLINWNVCFALKKLQEQVEQGIYKRILINSDRLFLNIAAATTYFETVSITNPARLRDLANKANAIIELHNNKFDGLENGINDQNVGYAFNTSGGGFLSVGCEIECIHIRGKEFSKVIAYRDNYKDFALNNTFDIYSSQEFAYRCAALLNVITTFFTDDELQRNNINPTQLSYMQVRHHISDKEEIFLAALYEITKADPAAGISPMLIAQAIALAPAELPPFQYQLEETGHIKIVTDTKRIALTGTGMKAAREAAKDYQLTIVTVLNGHAIPIESEQLYRYIYYYRLSTQAATEPYKSITVGVSDFVQMSDRRLSFDPGGSAESVLLLHACDKIMQDLLSDSLPDQQTVKIMQRDLPNLPNYKPSDAPPVKNAEFFVFSRTRLRLPPPPNHRSVPDLIVETRAAINLVFKRKHKVLLLTFAQEENLSDLFKDAQTKEELNTRVTSLGSTAGEMDVHLLRTLTGETDPQVRSIQLLRKLLLSLDPGVDVHIKTLQNIAAVRNGYPAHKDKPDTLKAYDALGLAFPVNDYSGTWQTLLQHYLGALQGISDVIQQKYL